MKTIQVFAAPAMITLLAAAAWPMGAERQNQEALLGFESAARIQTLKSDWQESPAQAPAVQAREAPTKAEADLDAANGQEERPAGVDTLEKALEGYRALESRRILAPGDPSYENALLLQRLEGSRLAVGGRLEVVRGERGFLGQIPVALSLSDGDRTVVLLQKTFFREESLSRWQAGLPIGRAVRVHLTISGYNYRRVDNWPFVLGAMDVL